MLTIRVSVPRRAPMLPAPDPTMTRDEHRDRAAWHLYELVKPEGGLSWWQLSPAQQARYRGFIHMVERSSDNTAVRAAHEALAELLAIQNDESLAIVPVEIQVSYRQRALALAMMWERVLTTGTPTTDAKILSRVTTQLEAMRRARRTS